MVPDRKLYVRGSPTDSTEQFWTRPCASHFRRHAMAPSPVVALRSPRVEALLTDLTRQQQRKIEELERKVHEQSNVLKMQKRSPSPLRSGSPGDHLELALNHTCQALSSAASRWCSCHSRAQTPDEKAQTGGGARAGMSTKGGRRIISREGSPVRDTSGNGADGRERKTQYPSWESNAERMLQKRVPTSMIMATQNDISEPLSDHEYILEDEWGLVPTNGVINPKSSWKETWDIGVLALILYSSVTVPFRICFSAEAEGKMWDFEVFVSIFFIVDVCFNFNTSYNVEDKWVISRRRIIKRYLSGWFWIDAPSSLPVELLTMIMGEGEGSSHLSLLRFLRMFRLLRLLRLLKVRRHTPCSDSTPVSSPQCALSSSYHARRPAGRQVCCSA